jgi:hypothetical protein
VAAWLLVNDLYNAVLILFVPLMFTQELSSYPSKDAVSELYLSVPLVGISGRSAVVPTDISRPPVDPIVNKVVLLGVIVSVVKSKSINLSY